MLIWENYRSQIKDDIAVKNRSRLYFFIITFLFFLLQAQAFGKAESQMDQFIVIGDTGKQTTAQRDVAYSLKKYCELTDKSCDAAILLGDNVYDAGMESSNDPIMDIVFKDYYQNLAFPFYAILGNHDYGKLGRSLKRANFQLEYSKRNPQFIMPQRYYYKVYKNAVVVFLDTTRMMWNNDISAQEELINNAKKIAIEKKLWLIVAGHHPLLSNGNHGNAGDYERTSFPAFVSGKHVKNFLLNHVCPNADVYLAGHDHSLQALPGSKAGCKSYLIVSGAGGSGYELSKRNVVDFEAPIPGYFHFNIGARELVMTAVNAAAEEVFSKTLSR